MKLTPNTQVIAANKEEEQILICFRAMTKESQDRCLERVELSAVLYPRIRQPILGLIRGGQA